jgi:hypothetical protein
VIRRQLPAATSVIRCLLLSVRSGVNEAARRQAGNPAGQGVPAPAGARPR